MNCMGVFDCRAILTLAARCTCVVIWYARNGVTSAIEVLLFEEARREERMKEDVATHSQREATTNKKDKQRGRRRSRRGTDSLME